MCELIQFMYQGAVSVKQTELSTFMKIAQTLQIRGLTTNPNNTHQPSTSSLSAEKQSVSEKPSIQSNSSSSQRLENTAECTSNSKANNQNESNSSQNLAISNNIIQPKLSPESSCLKRLNEYSTDSLSIYAKKQRTRGNVEGSASSGSSADDMQNDSMDQMNHDDVFIPPIPQISMIEPRFDLNNVKREHNDQPNSPGPMRGCGPSQLPPSFPSFDYNAYSAVAAAAAKQQIEYPNDLHMPNDYSKNNFNNHMDIPASKVFEYIFACF